MAFSISDELAREIKDFTGENVFSCFQCQKCSSGCPVSEYFDLAPNQLIRFIQLGLKEEVLRAQTLWLCAMCETCAVRCPHDINITKIMDYLRIVAQKEGKVSPLPKAVIFNRAALRGVKIFGRMYELQLMGEVYLRQAISRTLSWSSFIKEEIPIAYQLWKKGRLTLLPSFGKPKLALHKEKKRESIAYYPGCSLHQTAKEYDIATRAVFRALDVAVEEPKDWSCCGSTPAHCTDYELSLLLPLKDLVYMEGEGYNYLTTPCPSCFLRLRYAQREFKKPGLREEIEKKLGVLPKEEIKVDHLLETLTEVVGLERIKRRVKRNLGRWKVVCYYGCIITRPPKITGHQHHENPSEMEKLVQALGLKPLDWSYRTRCCGATLGISQPSIALKLTEKILRNAKAVTAQAIIVACPLCQINLDTRQEQISRLSGEQFHIPIIYISQLIGLAFGYSEKELGLDKNFIPLVNEKFWHGPINEKIYPE